MGAKILLYVPNLIGYFRLLLIVISWFTSATHPTISIASYIISALFDAVDGYAARKLKQTSAFGAWLDVVIDILGRGMLWCNLYHFGYLVAALEWLTFVCTHSLGAAWKSAFVSEPWMVQKVMANNFKSPLGVATIAGLHGLPVWLYCHYNGILSNLFVPMSLQYATIGCLSAGRALCMAVEVWVIYGHVRYLISDEANKPNKPVTSGHFPETDPLLKDKPSHEK